MIATTSRPAQEPAKAAGPAGHFDLQGLLSRPYPAVMGVLNVTPDSFSDGGQFATPERALAGLEMVAIMRSLCAVRVGKSRREKGPLRPAGVASSS